ncbi:MAG TPA: hypothetical protein VK281_01730 [Xanthobacteraceae bacterium]|nr:hypothetical protein [Xanthobacteraceae bacterium]
MSHLAPQNACGRRFRGFGDEIANWRVAANRQFAFGSFRFDARSGQLWRDDREVKLTT